MKAHARILRSNPVFARFSGRTINRLTAHSQIVEFPKGSIIYEAGATAESMYVILSGRCQAQVMLSDGTTQILEIYVPGDTFGERALVSGDRHWTAVKVITDTVLLRIAAEDVNYLFERSPKLARELVLRLVDQLNAFREERHAPELGRVAAFTRISGASQASVIAENVATALQQETNASVVYIHLVPGDVSPFLAAWEEVCRPSAEAAAGSEDKRVEKVRLNMGKEAGVVEVAAPMIGHLASRFRYVILLLDEHVPADAVAEFIKQADVAYVLFSQTAHDLYHANLLVRHLRGDPTSETEVLPIVCLEYEERAHTYTELHESLGVEVHSVVHGLPRSTGGDPHMHYAHSAQGRFSSHIRNLAREIGRCRVGLALSSGGAKGFAYVGIIQVLEEHGIYIDMVAGTSMGAYIGALWCYGVSGQEMMPLAMRMTRRWALFRLIDPAVPPRRGFMRGGKIRRMLQESIGDAHYSDMVREFRVVATDLDTLERIVFDSGEVAPCVQASIAMPGVFVPVDVGGRNVIDGGIADPLPVDVLMEAGVERIIAVNTIPNPEVMRSRMEMGREVAALPRRHARSLSSFGQYVNYFAPGNILDVMMRGIHGAQTRVSEGACQQADVVLRPVSPIGKWHDFMNAANYVELGRETAMEHIDEIKKLVTRG